jgi:DNA invertase Pin-like site-specific DNA recombinase
MILLGAAPPRFPAHKFVNRLQVICTGLMLSVLGGVTEFERSIIRERQKEGIAVAKGKGAYRGRKRALR